MNKIKYDESNPHSKFTKQQAILIKNACNKYQKLWSHYKRKISKLKQEWSSIKKEIGLNAMAKKYNVHKSTIYRIANELDANNLRKKI